jgi:hypothetical protein
MLALAAALATSAPADDVPRQVAPDLADDAAIAPLAATCGRCHSEHPSLLPLMEKPRLVRHDEYTVWSNKDPHRHAYEGLSKPRSQEIAANLRWEKRPAEDARCLSCHTATTRPKSPLVNEGVGCVACHGESGSWLANHALGDPLQWMALSAAAKSRQGMRDLRDPKARAQLCLSCHVGDTYRSRVITHEMFAAGHPPFRPIEVMNDSEGMPAHWLPPAETEFLQSADETLQRNGYHYKPGEYLKARGVAVAGLATLRHVVGFLGDEADRAVSAGTTLDFARFDCTSCHHELAIGEPGSPRQLRGFPAAPGRPPLPYWAQAIALLPPDLELSTSVVLTEPGALQPLFQALGHRPFGDPVKVARGGKIVIALIDEAIARFEEPVFARAQAAELVRRLTIWVLREPMDYETACQVTWALRTLIEELDKTGSRPVTRGSIALHELDKLLGVTSPRSEERSGDWLQKQGNFRSSDFREIFLRHFRR